MASQMTGAEIRSSFIDHFRGKGHTIVPSSPLVPDNDPTLMFTNSGMVQFKNNFTGADTRLKRAASVQRCVRAGGKHNDLENVGNTARHHTFFEMLGNFSFGDYFKEESLTWGWEWVTEKLRLDPSRMCVTVYHDDDEAYQIWRKIGMADKDIIRIATSDNFWTMGDTGPCGPCSEIFYDLDPSGKMYGDRWMEIWNHVFTQFDLQKDGSKVPLKNKNIDTGAGLERIITVVQGVQSNYDTDIFQALIGATAKLAGVQYQPRGEYYSSDSNSGWENKKLLSEAEYGPHNVSLRVIADHLRAMTFLMVDGVTPSNEGRGYVLRRIMRRAMRHGNLLGMDKPFIHHLVPTLVGVMGEAYPELARGATMAMDVIKVEEERFGRTLKQGMALLDTETKSLKTGDTLGGDVVFKLYDTYGFPVDLTADALKSRGIGLDMPGFETEMAAQRARARAAHKGSGDTALEAVWFDVQDDCGPTEFLGYKTLVAEGVVQGLVQNGQKAQWIECGSPAKVITNQTPFYAESGGQVGDTGMMIGEDFRARVTDVQKVLDGMFVHDVVVEQGMLKVGDPVELKVDAERRANIARNHSVTHLLFAGLRKVLGEHVVQRGSRQDDARTRFDISHAKAVTPEELAEVERFVNQKIWANLPVVTRILSKEDAVQSGATAQFGEKYDNEVRVVYMGTPESSSMVTSDLCGGTHVTQTGEIGLFRIVSESSVAAGIRRIEGLTHMAAFESFATDASTVKHVAGLLKTKPEGIAERITALQQGGKAKAAAPALDITPLAAQAQNMGGMQAVVCQVEASDADTVRDAVERLKEKMQSGVILLGFQADDKVTLVAGVTKDLTSKVQAGNLIAAAAGAIGGRGGGKPELAMGGGTGNLAEALQAGRNAIQ